ncbi:hypothetical protein ABBQ32_010114 [Trebouxia sp. C0010 RCD-2024]
MAATYVHYVRYDSDILVSGVKGEGMPRADENTQADLTSCPDVFSLRPLQCRAGAKSSSCMHKLGNTNCSPG